jgi:hypothetical protein
MSLRAPSAVAFAAVLAVTPAAPRTVPEGSWGADGAGVTVTRDGVRLFFDCAHGSIDGAVALDADGRFDARGVYVKESPGPTRPGASDGEPVRYVGRIDGDAMTLSILRPGSDQPVGNFRLQKSRLPRVRECG